MAAAKDTETWEERWTAARTARAAGRTSAAIDLTFKVIQQKPCSPEPYSEAADFFWELQINLASVERLYQKHREAFGLDADDLTWRPAQFPIARDGLSQITSLLRIACGAAPENAGWQNTLAEALTRLGDPREAIDQREHIARMFPAFQENQWELLRLLERTGNYGRARLYGEDLIVRAVAAPEAIAALARVYDRLGETQIVHLLYERVRTQIRQHDNGLPEFVDFLFRLAWTAARDGLPAGSEELRKDLRRYSAEAVKKNAADAKARLAQGYVCLSDGDSNQAKACFALASWLVSRTSVQLIDRPATDTFGSALRFARAFLVDLAPPPMSVDEVPDVHGNELALAHAYWLRKSGRFIDALTELARWLAAGPNVILPRMYNGHHIALRNGVYFGVPLTEKRFTIIGGKAYRVTPLVTLIARLVPVRVRTLVHRTSPTELPIQSHRTRSLRSRIRSLLVNRYIRRVIVALVRPVLVGQSISNALQAPDLYKLFADIDKQLISPNSRPTAE